MAKDIEINVKANTAQAKREFDSLNKSVDELKKGSEELSDSFVDASGTFEEAGEAVESVKTKFLTLTSGLIAGGGVVVALIAAKEAARIIGNEFRSMSADLTDLSGQLRVNYSETYKAAEAWGEFRKEVEKMQLYELREALETVNRTIDDLGLSFMEAGFAALGFTSATIKMANEYKKLIEQRNILQGRVSGTDEPESILGRLKTQIKINEELRDAAQTLNEITRHQSVITALQEQYDSLVKPGKHKEVTKEIIKQVSEYEKMIIRIKELRAAFQEQQVTHRAGQTRYGGLGDRASRETQGMVGMPEKPLLVFPELEKLQQDAQQFAQSTAAVFQMNMNAAWQGVFGEANSMFEQLVASWADLLFQRLSESIADAFVTDVLSQIPGLGFLSEL